jgi:cell division initiation protein
MKLTPLDIRRKEFKRGMRGYADVEVDEYLDEVADEYERLFKENIDLTERVEALDEKVEQYRRIEDTLQKTLISAQASAEELKQNATKEAELILKDAELKARQLVNESYSEKQAIEQSMAKLRGSQQDFAFKFRQLLESYLAQLDEAAVPAAEAAGGDLERKAEAIKASIARETPPEPAADPDETTMAAGPEPSQEDGRQAVKVGDDDLLADVDSGVNEDEFTW